MKIACPGCGKKLQVKDEFAGKKCKCPECGQVLQIPAASPSQQTANSGGCENCGQPMAPDAVLCTGCGYNRATGAVMQTNIGGGGPVISSSPPTRSVDMGSIIKPIVMAVVAIGIIGGGFLAFKSLTSGAGLVSLRGLIRNGEIAEAASSADEMAESLEGEDRELALLYAAQMKLEAEKNVGQVFARAQDISPPNFSMRKTKYDVQKSGIKMHLEITNSGEESITLKNDHFYLRGTDDIVLVEPHTENSLHNQKIAAGETLNGIVVFRRWPMVLVTVSMGDREKIFCTLIFNDGSTYAKIKFTP